MKSKLLHSSCYRYVPACLATFFSFILFSSQLFSQSVISAKTISNTIASGGDIYGLGTTTDASGNIYLVGWFRATVDMDPGAGVYNMISNGTDDCFLAKYSSTGTFLWARSWGSGDQDLSRTVLIDPSGNLIVCGVFARTVDFDPGPGVSKVTSNGNQDVYISKFTPAGDFVYVKTFGGLTNDVVGGMTLDASGNIYLTGYITSAEVDFDPGPGVRTITKLGSSDGYVMSLDNNGNHRWSFTMGATSSQVSPNRTAISSDGFVYVTGSMYGTNPIDFNPDAAVNNLTSVGASDVFVAKYSTAGVYSNCFQLGGTGSDIGYGLATDGSGNVYVAGQFETTVDFNPSSSVTNNLTSLGYQDVFIAKYNSAGVYQYAKSIGTAAGSEMVNNIISDASGNVVMCGYYANTMDADPGAGVTNLVSNGSWDAYVIKLTNAGVLTWARSIGGTLLDQAIALSQDASGNINITGYFNGTMDIDPGAGVKNVTSPTSIGSMFSLKLSSVGAHVSSFIPQAYTQNAASQQVNATWVDKDNNYYITGGFGKTVDFDPGPGVTTVTSVGYLDFFVAKYNAAGDLLFVKILTNTNGGNYGSAIATDASGNIYIAGRFQGTLDMNPGAGIANLTSNGQTDIFLLKLTSAGNYISAVAMGGTSVDGATAMVLDNAANIYITGVFYNAVDFDPGAATKTLTAKGGQDAFVAKYNSSLQLVWAAQLGGTSTEQGNDIAVDNSGNVYTTGNFWSTVDFDPGTGIFNLTSAGTGDAFVSKLDKDGNFVYAFQLGSSGNDNGFALALDADGNLLVGGNFNGTTDFDPGSGTTNLTSAGSIDAFLAKYNPSGNLIAARSFGGTDVDQIIKIKLDSKGNVYIAGTFASPQLPFYYKGSPVYYSTAGDADIFMAVLNPELNYLAGRNIGGAQTDQLGGLALDATGNIYVAGNFAGLATIDNLTGSDAYPFKTISTRDIFLAKFSVPEILPVTLEKFTAVPQRSEVLTKWTVSAQLNNEYFEVERSANGTQFTAIGRIAGCANCAEKMDYQFTDKQPLPGASYYRLKQTDIDGNYTYSKVVRVIFTDHAGKLTLYPTVTNSEFTLTYNNKATTDQPAMIRVVSATGTTIQNVKLVLKPGMNNIPLSLMKQAAGNYYVNLILTTSNSVQTATVIKQ